MKKFKYLSAAILIISILAPAVGLAISNGLGEYFYGSVTINGAPAPDGTSIGVKVNNVLVGSTATKNGKYGYWPSELAVFDPDGSRAGKQVKLLVNDQLVSSDLVYVEGKSVLKDLSLTGGQVLGESTYTFKRYLTFGSSGQEVTELQKRLTSEGVYSGPITGYFGPLTLKAVKAYQMKNNIQATGTVGPKTRGQLNS